MNEAAARLVVCLVGRRHKEEKKGGHNSLRAGERVMARVLIGRQTPEREEGRNGLLLPALTGSG